MSNANDDDDDETRLSAQTLAALQEFLTEQTQEKEKIEAAKDGSGDVDDVELSENWKLEQFWFDDATAETLAREAVDIAGEKGRVACLSVPTAYKKIRELKQKKCIAKCMEYDRRFDIYGDDYVFYYYKNPVFFPTRWKNKFDVVLVEPPVTSEECLRNVAESIKFLAKDKFIICTDASLEALTKELLNVEVCKFKPHHKKELLNLRCFTNYQSDRLNETA